MDKYSKNVNRPFALNQHVFDTGKVCLKLVEIYAIKTTTDSLFMKEIFYAIFLQDTFYYFCATYNVDCELLFHVSSLCFHFSAVISEKRVEELEKCVYF
jgi:hypothetical protein